MAKLLNQSKNKILSSHLEIAESFASRAQGLLGRPSLAPESALWILPCKSIHTFFMQFSIDVAFVDRNLVVRKIQKQIHPFRLAIAPWRTHSVFEFSSGVLNQDNISIGDQLHVDH